jgi:hypothetical protein
VEDVELEREESRERRGERRVRRERWVVLGVGLVVLEVDMVVWLRGGIDGFKLVLDNGEG